MINTTNETEEGLEIHLQQLVAGIHAEIQLINQAIDEKTI